MVIEMLTTDFSDWTWQNIIVRILVSVAIGMVIGIDRGAKRRGGGARTTITVCLGATVVMLMEQYLKQLFPEQFDISRLAAQVISGVGFLGAGSILVSGHQIKGLTSAASIWICACIGLIVGIGFIDGAVLCTAVWLISIHLVPFIEDRVYKHTRYMTLYIEIEDGKAISNVSRQLKESNCFVDSFYVDKPKAKGQHFQIVATFRLPRKVSRDDYLHTLQQLKGVVYMDEI